MAFVPNLTSNRIVLVAPTQRLSDVEAEIEEKKAIYCIVREGDGKFAGIVRLTETVKKSADRIFADLMSSWRPLCISESLDAEMVVKLLEAQGCDEIVVLAAGKKYAGLVTRESVGAWRAARRGNHPPL